MAHRRDRGDKPPKGKTIWPHRHKPVVMNEWPDNKDSRYKYQDLKCIKGCGWNKIKRVKR